MARKTLQQALADIDLKKKRLEAKLASLERKQDTRRKVLLGALLLQRIETSADAAQAKMLTDWLKRELPGFLTREGDRDLLADLLEAKPAAIATTPTVPSETPTAAPDVQAAA
jgi:hypothetical protein